jgi:hypothetical protein
MNAHPCSIGFHAADCSLADRQEGSDGERERADEILAD